MKNISRYFSLLALAAAIPAMAQDAETPAEAKAADENKTIEVALGEVVPEWSYTGAVSTVTSEELGYWQTTSLSEALVGKLAGYYNNGNVRGLNSSNGSALLVVLDGIPSPTLTLADIDPRSVESVTVLKDAAAKALYGPLGAQGVFLVNTKRGHAGKTTVRAQANFGWEQPTVKPKTVNSLTYATLRNQSLLNDGLAARYSAADMASFADGTGMDNNWADMYMNNFRPAQNYNIEVAGGNERTKFFINVGYSHIGSLYKGEFKEKFNPEHYTRSFNVASNIQVKMFSFLKMFTAVNLRIGHDNATSSLLDKDGNPELIQSFYTTPSAVSNQVVNGHLIADENFTNPIYGQINYKGVNKVTSTDVNANFGLDFDLGFLTKGLTARAQVGYNSNYAGTRKGSYDYARWIINDEGALQQLGTNNDDPLTWDKSSQMIYFMNFQAMVQWQRDFGKHSFDAFVNYIAEDRLGSSTQAAWLLPYNRIQVGGHFKYGFDNRYFAQFDCTYAGNEEMMEGHQFHFSPTGSLAWVASNEAFLKDVDWLDLLKFRGSFGALEYDVLWNMPNRYLYASEYRITKGGAIGNIYTNALLAEGIIGNPEIKWEKSYQQDYGFDAAFLNNSLNVSFDYWRTNQRGVIIQEQTVPSISGIGQSNMPYSNLGKIKNEGVDLQVSYTKDFGSVGFTAGADLGWNRNKFEYAADLDYTSQNYAYAFRKTGYALGQEFGYLVDYSKGNGFYNTQAEIDNSGLTYQGMTPRVGDFRYRDLNGDGIIDEADKAPLDGVKDQPNLNYGASFKLTWNNFDLYLYFQGESGRNRLLTGLGYWENQKQGTYFEHHLNAWTPERYAAGEEISYPALTSSTSSSLQKNDFFVSKADYFRLKNLTIGYTLPRKWLDKIGFQTVRFYFTGQNLLTAHNMKFKGMDPENTVLGNFTYRSYNIGVNIAF